MDLLVENFLDCVSNDLLSRMDTFTKLFWMFTIVFLALSAYLVCCTKSTNIFYIQIASGCGIFAMSKIGRTFLGLEA